jgi:hypothetical protein
MKKLLYIGRSAVATVSAMSLPLFAMAASVGSILATVQKILSTLIPIVFTIALLYFLWGLASYIMSAGNEESQKKAREHMIYGIVALFVMVAVWGLIGAVGTTFGINAGGAAIPLPEVVPIQSY